MTSELLSCPFCGGEARVARAIGSSVRFASCIACEAFGPSRDTEAEAIAAWNRRSPAGDREQIARIIDPDCFDALGQPFHGYGYQRALAKADAILAISTRAPSVGERQPPDAGVKLVPVEPTEEMLDGRARDILLNDRMGMTPSGRSTGRATKAYVIGEIYAAMLAAAPPYFASLSPVDGGSVGISPSEMPSPSLATVAYEPSGGSVSDV